MHAISQYSPVVNIIFQISQKHNNYYCYPSQKTILKILSEIYDIRRSISTLNRWLRRLEDAKLFKRHRRIGRGPNNQIHFRSTMYFLKKKGTLYLNRLGYDVWSVLEKWYKNSDSAQARAKASRTQKSEKKISREEFIKLLESEEGSNPTES